MWAHYAENHSGIVIGFDVSRDSFSSKELNLIPAQEGAVIYSRTKPSGYAEWSPSLDPFFETPLEAYTYEAKQRMFLYKQDSWAYEEEVRIVKSLIDGQNTKDPFDVGLRKGKDDYLYMELSSEDVTEVIFGMRTEAIFQQKKASYPRSGDRTISSINELRALISEKISIPNFIFAIPPDFEGQWDMTFERGWAR